MTSDSCSATRTLAAPPEAVFEVLADPAMHAAIDGTGWVVAPLDSAPLTEVGQLFRMDMFHPEHPDGGYRMANRVIVLQRPTAIAWDPLHYTDSGGLESGGWFWRYDLEPVGPDATRVTLTYDWSAATEETRGYLHFPPFPPDHLGNSLDHLAELVAARS